MRFVKVALTACLMAAATVAMAGQSGIHVRAIRVLATDPDALAAFYEKAFGMSETRRPVNTATTKEIVINSGLTPDIARRATLIVVEHHALGDFAAFDARGLGQIDIERVGLGMVVDLHGVKPRSGHAL